MFLNSKKSSSETETLISETAWIPLIDLAQMDEIKSLSEIRPVLIFKHSTRCGISRMVLKVFEQSFNWNEQTPAYYLDLLNYREISNHIAETFGVIHQSPQLLLIQKGSPVYVASHGDISADGLKWYI